MKRYQSKHLKQKKRNKKLSVVLFTLIFLALIANTIIFITISKYSKLSAVDATGLSDGQDPGEFIELMKIQAQDGLLATLLGLDNYFSWSTKINYKNSQYKKITIEKSFSDRTVTFNVQRRQRYANWCKIETETQIENCRWIDNEGVAFEPSPSTSGQLIPSIKEEVRSATFSANAQIMPSHLFNYVKDILTLTQELGIHRDSVYLLRPLQELQIKTIDGTTIIFSLRFDPKTSALPAIARFQKNPGLETIKELNLAVEGRAFTTAR